MKYIHILLIVVLALGFLAFGPQSSATAAGTVTNPSGQDSGSCVAGKLQTGFVTVYVNGELVDACTAFVQKASGFPGAPGGLKVFSYPVKVFFSKDVSPKVTVCYPTKPKAVVGQIYKLDNGAWLAIPSYQSGKMTCGETWGGGTFAFAGW